MENVRVNLSSNEKIAREVSGLESNAKHFVLNGERADETLRRDAAEKFNTQVDEYIEKFNKHAENLGEYAKSVKENMNNLEIKAIYNYVLVKPFSENPFQRIVTTNTGLIVDLGGAKPTFKNPDNGNFEEEENLIHVGTVIDAGPKCEYLKEGDVIMWTKPSEVPVPFFRQGLVLVNENRVIVVVNEGLTERFAKRVNLKE